MLGDGDCVHNNGTIELVIDAENVKILWDVNIQTDHVIEHEWWRHLVDVRENN